MFKVSARRVRATRNYLWVAVEDRRGAVTRFYDVRVPWRLLNEEYEDVANHMAAEAIRHLKATHQEDPWLPLEKWE